MNVLPDLIRQPGLVIHAVYLPEAVALLAITFRPDKDLADDKEGYTAPYRVLCDSDVA